MSQSENPLQLASKSELITIRCFLEGQLPQACDIYQSLVARMLVLSDSWRFYFKRGPDGSYETIVSLVKEKRFDPDLQMIEDIWVISVWMKNETSLMQILEEVDEIDWLNTKWVIFGCQKTHLLSWNQNASINIFSDPVASYILPISEALSIQIEIPDDVYVTSLERKHASIVYDHWPYKSTTSAEYVADEIDWLPSAGVFLKNGDVLVSWIMSHPPNGMSRLHTLEPYRRRGYAALAVRYMAKRMAQSGYVPFANVSQTNESSRKVFECLGFQFMQDSFIAKYPLQVFHT